MPSGGKIAPDGRPPVAPGVGKTARRHDLEAPATPGITDSDLQQGDVQRLEQAQKIAPRAKRTQPPAQASGTPRSRTTVNGPPQGGVPDPIEMASGKIGGQNPAIPNTGGQRLVDPGPWVPLLHNLATRPNSGGAIAATLTDMLRQYAQRPVVPSAYFIDMNDMDEQIAREL